MAIQLPTRVPQSPSDGAIPARELAVTPTEPAWMRSPFCERTGLRALCYPVPEHANGLLYTLGGITLVGFVTLILTGIYLAQFYHPHPSEAHNSIIYIMTSAPFGDVIRGIHYWAAIVVSIGVSLHLTADVRLGKLQGTPRGQLARRVGATCGDSGIRLHWHGGQVGPGGNRSPRA